LKILDIGSVGTEDAFGELSDIEFVAFDTETTGLSPVSSRLVEISGVKFKLGVDAVEVFSTLINPRCLIPREATRVHGITNEMVESAPPVEDVLPGFFSWINKRNTALIAHNAPFDLGFVKVAANIMQAPVPNKYVIDTLRLSRKLLSKAVPNHQLGTLVNHFNLPSGGYHRALADSYHVRNLVNILVDEYSLRYWQDLSDLGALLQLNQQEQSGETPAQVQNFVHVINTAITDDKPVSFRYNGMRSRPRRVKPQAVVQNNGLFYLTAFCYYFEAERTFRLDKMSEVKLVKAAAR
jgi:DNA polymerase III epsilon subunit family exonuclease